MIARRSRLAAGVLAVSLVAIGCGPPPPALPAAVAAGAPPPVVTPGETTPVAPPGTLTFARDIAPIVFERCAPCHRPGESGPFDLLDYEDVRTHAEQIAVVTASRYMPPWLPEPTDARFVGERRLSDREIALIGQWVSEGAAAGDRDDIPPLPEFVSGWQLGEPDLVVPLPATYRLPAGDQDVFRNFVFPLELDETRHVQSLEFRPTNPRAIHHATIAVDRSPRSRLKDAEDPEAGFDGMINVGAQRPDGHLLGWVPGRLAQPGDPRIAWAMQPGSDLVVQLHLQPTGKPEDIRPRVGLHFADGPAERRPVLLRIGSLVHDIAPGVAEYPIEDTFVLPVDVHVLGMVPHAHYLAREMRAWAVLPDGARQDLLWIRDWDFNWQDEYRLVEPLELPAGTALSMRFVYDNSSDNPQNPVDPPRRVTYGPRTIDEMGDLWIQVLPVREGDRSRLEQIFRARDNRQQIAGLRQLMELYPDDAAMRTELGRMLLVLGEVDEAIAELQVALQARPNDALGHAQLGEAFRRRGDGPSALAAVQQAVELEPTIPEFHYNLGQLQLAARRPADAAVSFGRAIELRPALVEAHVGLGNARLQRRDVEGAVESFRAALAVDPDRARTRNNLGSALGMRGDVAAALVEFQRAVELDPAYGRARYNLGGTLAQLGRFAEALPHLEEAVRLQPDHEPSRRALAAVRNRLSGG